MSRNSNGYINNGRRILQTGQYDQNAKIEINLASGNGSRARQGRVQKALLFPDYNNESPGARESITLRYNEKNVERDSAFPRLRFRACKRTRIKYNLGTRVRGQRPSPSPLQDALLSLSKA